MGRPATCGTVTAAVSATAGAGTECAHNTVTSAILVSGQPVGASPGGRASIRAPGRRTAPSHLETLACTSPIPVQLTEYTSVSRRKEARMTGPVPETHRSPGPEKHRQTVPLGSWTIWVVVTAAALPVSSQPESWEVLVPSDSLQSRQVLSLAVDKSGVIWIGTNQGAARLEEGGTLDWVGTLGGRAIRDVAVDREGTKWFATDEGVLSFDDQDWARYGVAEGLVSREVTSIAVDSQNVKWFGTKYGLSRFDGLTWSSFGLPDDSIVQVATGSEGGLWLATRSGVVHYDGEKWKALPASDGSGPVPTSIAVDRHGVVVYDGGLPVASVHSWVMEL